MIKNAKKNAPRKPRVMAQADLTHVTGGDPASAKIRETVVAD
jgi:hypothetical protein